MLTQVILETSDPMVLDIDGVNGDEIVVLQSISGLLPGDISLFTGEFARSGGYYQGRRVGQRNPVFNLKLNPHYKDDIEISDVREMLYKQFYEPHGDSDAIQVRLKDDRKPDRYFHCYAEKWNGDLFSNNTTAQISTLCVDPFLYSVEEVDEASLDGWISVPIEYEGSADTGVWLAVLVTANTDKVRIFVDDQQFTLEHDFVVGDALYVSTTPGERFVRKGNTDIMAALTADSKWLQLRKPNHTLSVDGGVPGDGVALIVRYKYRGTWWGV